MTLVGRGVPGIDNISSISITHGLFISSYEGPKKKIIHVPLSWYPILKVFSPFSGGLSKTSQLLYGILPGAQSVLVSVQARCSVIGDRVCFY